MIASLSDILFGCWHSNYSFPLTSGADTPKERTYVVCLECGKEFSYDWKQMKVVTDTRTMGQVVEFQKTATQEKRI